MDTNDFLAKHAVTMTVTRTDANPMMDDGGARMDHWRCVLRLGRPRMTVIFSMGSGHHGREPTVADVLDSLASDASYSGDSFAEFCANLGYDPDSRKAERIYRACRSIKLRLEGLLGAEAFAELQECERL